MVLLEAERGDGQRPDVVVAIAEHGVVLFSPRVAPFRLSIHNLQWHSTEPTLKMAREEPRGEPLAEIE